MLNILQSSIIGLTLALAVGFSPMASAENTLTSQPEREWVGHTAPIYKLQDQYGKWHQSSQYLGQWVVLYFYPKDNSPGCTQEANAFKALYPQFLKHHAVVLGVSLDDVQSHQKFSEKLKLPFPILADDKQILAKSFEIVRNFGILQVAKRETFLIDPKGNVVYHYTSVNSQTHADQVLKDIQANQK